MQRTLSAGHRRTAHQSRLFASLPADLSDILLDAAHVLRLDRGQVLFRHGDEATAIHIVAEGWIKLYRIAPNGAEAVVGVMTRGQSFGEPIAPRRLPYPVTAEAVTGCELIAVPARVFLEILETRPEAAISILSGFAMIVFSFSGLWRYVRMWRQRKDRSLKPGLFWK